VSVPGEFEWFADWCDGTAPLYARLSEGVVQDETLQALAAEIPEQRTRPNVLFAAVHYLLLEGADHPLGSFYASVAGDPLDPTDHDPVPAFRDFCITYREDLEPLLRTRTTQTNSVRRCAALYPAFAHVAALEDEPLSLVEVGPSAGLNLRWDRYGYDYGDGRQVGAEDPPLVVESTARGGDPPLPADPPAVRDRVGVDLDPMDVTDPADAQWLRAITWPDQVERRAVLDQALRAAAADPPDIVAGDAVEALPDVLADLPDPVVVYNTQVLYQLDDDARERFRETLATAGTGRRLHWLSGETPVDADAPEMWLEHATVEGGDLAAERLLAYEQHGRYLRWTGE